MKKIKPREILEIFESWEKDKRLNALYIGCTMALSIWDDHVRDRKIKYRDSMVGIEHVVENDLPVDAMKAIKCHIDGKEPKEINSIKQRYLEPISAMQDYDYYSIDEFDYWDLNFPQHVEYGYYSIYITYSGWSSSLKLPLKNRSLAINS